MAQASEIKSRINSISDTKKVTDAMYMISSVKMQKAMREVENTQPFFNALRQEIGELLHYLPETDNPYFRWNRTEESEGRAVLLITSDKGLAGSYNHVAIHAAEEQLQKHRLMRLYVVGEYGRQYFMNKSHRFVKEFSYSAGFPTIRVAQQICADLLEDFDSKKIDEIDILYTHFHGGKPGECKKRTLLPLNRSNFYDAEEQIPVGKEFYPDPNTVLNGIVPSYLTGYIYSALVESYCGEQNARMTAMKTAGDNAEEMLKKLRMQYNSVRQAAITREMTELTSGTRALRKNRQKAKTRREDAE